MKKLNRKILITGGAGYIGQNLISFFLKKLSFKVSISYESPARISVSFAEAGINTKLAEDLLSLILS